MKLLLRILIFASAIYVGYSLCNACSAVSGLACVSNTQFQVCVNGLPSGFVSTCPTGYVCSSGAMVCAVEGTVTPSCNNCGQCNAQNVFACTGYNTFALCYGTTVPANVNFTCAGSQVCNIDSPTICIDPATAGIGGTCPSVTGTVTTTAAPPDPATDPAAYCASVAQAGRYEVTTDTTCREYVLCALVNSTWIGGVYTCPGSTLFNSTSALCGVERPERCPLT